MLQNAYFLAKIGADTAENEQHFAEISRTDALSKLSRRRRARRRSQSCTAWVAIPTPIQEDPTPWVAIRDHYLVQLVRGLGLAKLANFCKILQIFGGLVLGRIKTKFCKKICV